MNLKKIIDENFNEHLKVIESVHQSLSELIITVGQLLAQSLARGSILFWCGNGGSAADSQHMAAELIGRFKNNRRPLRSIALTTDTSILTCIANDYSYEDVFARQIEGLGHVGDVVIGISTSGNSENVVRAFKAAKRMGLMTVALLGKGGGVAQNLVDYSLVIPSNITARIQESHILIGHMLCEIIEQELGLA
ncbi:MAG: D-sedoheptulose 7-phosphate isomerase [Deltaproteobacteria bacterium]|nr:MAG: D-sedoheptulose 7-phosphate isomerase [Deltaproteobacteria bacterium]